MMEKSYQVTREERMRVLELQKLREEIESKKESVAALIREIENTEDKLGQRGMGVCHTY